MVLPELQQAQGSSQEHDYSGVNGAPTLGTDLQGPIQSLPHTPEVFVTAGTHCPATEAGQPCTPQCVGLQQGWCSYGAGSPLAGCTSPSTQAPWGLSLVPSSLFCPPPSHLTLSWVWSSTSHRGGPPFSTNPPSPSSTRCSTAQLLLLSITGCTCHSKDYCSQCSSRGKTLGPFTPPTAAHGASGFSHHYLGLSQVPNSSVFCLILLALK